MISKKLFGTLSDGREVDIYELKNANGVSASVITYSATWQSLFAPDRDGKFEDVLIDFDAVSYTHLLSPVRRRTPTAPAASC